MRNWVARSTSDDPGGAGLIAAAATLYVVALWVLLPRLARGMVLRRDGSTGPIVVLGRTPGSPWPRAGAAGAGAGAGAGTAGRVDLAHQFFAGHTAGALARPLTAIHLADERLTGLSVSARCEAALVTSADGELLGAIGPRQIRNALDSDPVGARCVGAMVPMRSLTVIPGHVPATALLTDLAGRGFAMVRGNGVCAVAEAGDVRRQLQAWTPLQAGNRRRQPDVTAPRRPALDEPA